MNRKSISISWQVPFQVVASISEIRFRVRPAKKSRKSNSRNWMIRHKCKSWKLNKKVNEQKSCSWLIKLFLNNNIKYPINQITKTHGVNEVRTRLKSLFKTKVLTLSGFNWSQWIQPMSADTTKFNWIHPVAQVLNKIWRASKPWPIGNF